MTTTAALPDASFTLTRRGRLMLLGLPAILAAVAVLAGLILASTSLANSAAATSQELTGVEAVEVTVGQGDTLWTIASAAGAARDTQAVITQIAELNGLESSQLEPGQTLYVPVD